MTVWWYNITIYERKIRNGGSFVVKIISDSTCDLSKELRDYFWLEDYIMGYVQINEKSINTIIDWENI